ncbi:hypothetical protein PAXRUDRAFT_149142, partial [Paxillus rubicundulus Ve08.2h10]
LVFLPLYSPDFNPIEESFNVGKFINVLIMANSVLIFLHSQSSLLMPLVKAGE